MLKVGCDPEFFLTDTRKGIYVSAHDIVPGTKEEPFKVKQGAVQSDGVAVEFNIDPASSEEEFVDNIKVVLGEIRRMIPNHYEFVYRPAITFEPVYFKKLPRQAVEIGCIPDYSGYTFQANPRPDGAATTMRTGAGHVHIGWLEPENFWNPDVDGLDHHYECGRIARNLDITLGLKTLDWDRDRIRRSMYGKAGAYRPKPYGIEYRTPSNKWVSAIPYMQATYQAAIAGVQDYFDNGVKCKFMQERPGETQARIDGGN